MTISKKKSYLRQGKAYLALTLYRYAIDAGKKCIEISARDIGVTYYQPLELKFHHAFTPKQNGWESLFIEYMSVDVIAHLIVGRAYQCLEKYDEAIANLKKCINIVNNLDLPQIKEAPARAYLHLAQIYQSLEQYDDTVYYSKKCIDTAREIDHKITEVRAHTILAQEYLSKIQLNDAYLSINAGMAIVKELGNIASQIYQIDLIACRTRLYGFVGFPEKTSTYFLPAFLKLLISIYYFFPCTEKNLLKNLAAKAKTRDNSRGKRAAYSNLVDFYRFKNDHKKAIHYLEDQLKEMDLDPSMKLYCITLIARSYQEMGQDDMALRSYERGLPIAQSCSNEMLCSLFYHDYGLLLLSLKKDLHLAERYLREGIRCFEKMVKTLGSLDEFKISIFDKYIHGYKLLAMLLIKLGKPKEEALLVLDRCRARALKDLMMANYKMEQEESNDEHLEYSDVLALVSTNGFSISCYSLYCNVLLKFFLGKETPDGDNKLLHYSMCTNDSLETNVDTLFDEMGVRKVVNCEDRSLDKEQDIPTEQKRSQEEYEGLYHPTASLVAFLLNIDFQRESNENFLFHLPSSLLLLLLLLFSFIFFYYYKPIYVFIFITFFIIFYYFFYIDSAETTKASSLEDLFVILKCDRILSAKQDEVVVIPDGPLYKVPFPALRDPRTGKYLSETKRIRLAPSLATLKHFQNFPVGQTSNAQPLIIGDPLVGKVMMDGEETVIKPLPGARAEAAEISVLLDTPALLTIYATKPAVLERLQQGASLVHIAAHGILSKATIVLAPSPEIRATKIPVEKDYMLTMADVQQAQVRAQLVVLSCCHSGRGEIRAEGVVGMCRAFLASGARAVVASLWAIDDQATLEFMKEFYLRLKQGKSASVSLHEAMKEMRNCYSEPEYWAPFFLMGDDVTLKL